MRRRQDRLFEFANVLRAHPRQPVKVLAMWLQCRPKQIQNWLKELEVVESRGPDPINGRANVKLYEISLPDEKRKALA